jgi:cysteine-rich repeat protein
LRETQPRKKKAGRIMKRIVFFQILSVFIVLFFFAVPNSAQASFCGDGFIEGDEQCDPGSTIACDDDGTRDGDPGCSALCTVERCGNGTVECDEECDDGDGKDYTNECSATCKNQPAECGNGHVEAGEQCDDGNTEDFDGCSSTCQDQPPECGNGHIEAGEQCDDGNLTGDDGCDANCRDECGNGTVEGDEECDDGANDDYTFECSATCKNQPAVCGNGIRETPKEDCDPGPAIDCDDDGTPNGDPGCSADCTIEQCGNGIVECDEECDEFPTWETC